MKILGVELSYEDMVRIVSSVACTSVGMIKNAENAKDMKEALELHLLFIRLNEALSASLNNANDVSEENEQEAS